MNIHIIDTIPISIYIYTYYICRAAAGSQHSEARYFYGSFLKWVTPKHPKVDHFNIETPWVLGPFEETTIELLNASSK